MTDHDETAPEIDDDAPVVDALEQRKAAVPASNPEPDTVSDREVSDVDAADQAIPVIPDEDDASLTGDEWDER